MLRYRRRGLVCLTLVIGLGALVATTPAVGERQSVRVIRVKTVVISKSVRDKPPTGPSKGDVWVEHDALLNVTRQFGKPANVAVGSDTATVTFLSPTSARIVGTATLPGGTIRFRGTASLTDKTPHVPVIGGTGAYAHARGSSITSDDAANTYNTYRLTIP
jgi:hypothetical protein